MKTLSKSKLLTYLSTYTMGFFKNTFIFELPEPIQMIGKTRVFILILLFSGSGCLAQQLTNQVLLPCAGLATAGVLNYSHSVGETAVELLNNSGFILTQGFQQPGFKIPEGVIPDGTGVEVYPNPAIDFVYVKLFGDKARSLKIEVIRYNGTISTTINLEFFSSYYIIRQLEFSDFSPGFYFVRVSSSDGVINRIFKIGKM